MSDQSKFLVLGGPAHLNLVTLQDGAPELVVQEEPKEGDPLIQSFVYKRAALAVGTHPPVTFLIPSHLEGHPGDLAGWVFNQIVQALMSGHPLAGHVVLSLGFNVYDRDSTERVVRAEVRAHPVMPNGIVARTPIQKTEGSFRLDFRELVELKPEHAKARFREGAQRAMMLALRPLVDRTVDQIVERELKPRG